MTRPLTTGCPPVDTAHRYIGSDTAPFVSVLLVAIVIACVGTVLIWRARTARRLRTAVGLLATGLAIMTIQIGALLTVR